MKKVTAKEVLSELILCVCIYIIGGTGISMLLKYFLFHEPYGKEMLNSSLALGLTMCACNFLFWYVEKRLNDR